MPVLSAPKSLVEKVSDANHGMPALSPPKPDLIKFQALDVDEISVWVTAFVIAGAEISDCNLPGALTPPTPPQPRIAPTTKPSIKEAQKPPHVIPRSQLR